jgi:hypothetical protein
VVGGVVGLLLIIGIIYILLRRNRHMPDQDQGQEAVDVPRTTQSPDKEIEPTSSPVKPDSTSAALFKRPVHGRAELDSKENEPVVNVVQADSTLLTEVHGEGRHGLHLEELDANGRYTGELHGDGRHSTGAELP